jgi:hypothetical protein
MIRLFLSYRREDAGGQAGRLFDSLVTHYGHENVFMDIDTIAPGSDFVNVIDEALSKCDIALVMIGPHWLNAKTPNDQRRLDNPEDFVRIEIQTALMRDIRVVPLLVGGAVMPASGELPSDIDALARRHAFELSDRRWPQDVAELVRVLDRVAPPSQQDMANDTKRSEQPTPHDPQLSPDSRAARSPRPRIPRKPMLVLLVGIAVTIVVVLAVLAENRSPPSKGHAAAPAGCFDHWAASATPTKGLTNRQQVLVSVTGLSCNPDVSVSECASTTRADIAGPYDSFHCTDSQDFNGLSEGSATYTFTAQDKNVGGASFDCRKTSTLCWLVFDARKPGLTGSSSKTIPVSFR